MHLLLRNVLGRFILLSGILLQGRIVMAQLKADFTVDVKAGCSPLTVNFTNTTQNASSSAIYTWDFGNNGTSNEKNPAAVYTTEKTYTVVLTVKDGNGSDTKTATIIVYKKPVVDFSLSGNRGCAPYNVTFTSNSTPGDGTIEKYYWDFGDGNINQGASSAVVSHTYTFAQKPTIKLTVKNSYGCDATLEKSNVLEVTPGVRAAFTASQTVLCKVPGTITFSNTSTGPGTLTYNWDFGDTKTSTSATPDPVVYNTKGLYTVKMKVSSSEGCSDSLVKTNYVNAANFKSDFQLPSPVCSKRYLSFINQSQPAPSLSVWKFSDDNSTSTGYNASHNFMQSGNFTVQLINTYGTCSDTATKLVPVNLSPDLNGFLSDKNGGCKVPATISFEDTSAGAVKWKWYFGTGFTADTSTLQKPSFTFNQLRYYTVSLSVTNTQGCQSTVSRNIIFSRPNISFGYTKSNSTYGLYGCPGLTITFKSYPVGDVTDYRWVFGDGATSTEAEPEHRFDKSGMYTVKLYYKTVSGCEDSVVYPNYVRVYSKPKVDFESQSGLTICGTSPVKFKDLTDTASRWYWDFGDNTISYDKNPIHSYSSEGLFTVTLIATNQYCSDTTKKEQYIKLVPPFTDITNYTKNCADRGTLTFNQTTKGAVKWVWDFGDGSPFETYTVNKPQVTHIYTRSGVFKVFLFASNDQCTTVDTIHVSVLLKQTPLLSADKNVLCGSDTISFKVSGMDTIKYFYNYLNQNQVYPYSGRLTYSDGTIHSTLPNTWYPPQYSFKATNLRPREDSLRVITYDGINGCYDTSNYVSIKVSGPVAGFTYTKAVYCAGTKITFIDTSKGTGNAAIVKWIWDYGDNSRDTFLTSGNPTHAYHGANYFYPRLKVIDANGCSAQTSANVSQLIVYGPAANFYVTDSVVSPNTAVQFYNTTSLWPYYAVTYTWDFGDGSPASNVVAPTHVYTQSGSYTVKLIAKSSYGCADTLVKKEYINIKSIKSVFQYTTTYVNANNCPPLLANFESKSLNADSLFWSFGDNSYADNIRTPSHTYYQPGVYTVTLYVFGKGIMDSSVQQVTVKGPYGNILPDKLRGCLPTQVTFTADVKNAVNYTWDFGDGVVTQGKDTLVAHNFAKTGIYQPKIIMKDAGGCSATFLMKDTIIIDQLDVSFKPDRDILCDSGQVNFSTNTINFGEDSLKAPLRFHWNFDNGIGGDTSVAKNPHHNFNIPGEHIVALQLASAYGCTKTLYDTITVRAKPRAGIEAAATACEGSTISIRDTAVHNTGETWLWNFGNGQTSGKETPDPVLYSKPGTYPVLLVKNSANGCSDTAKHQLIVDGIKASIQGETRILCESGQVRFKGIVQAYSNDSLGHPLLYHWDFGTGNVGDTSAAGEATFNYKTPKTYPVQLMVRSFFGCTTSVADSIIVLKKPRATILSDTSICAGGQIQFRGHVEDTTSIKWTWDLANGTTATVQSPAVQIYPVAGRFTIRLSVYSTPLCTDTTYQAVFVHRNPEIGLQPKDTTICKGNSLQLQAHDGMTYNWTAGGAAQNSHAATLPVNPTVSTTYAVTASNEYHCSSRDSVTITVSQPFKVKAEPRSDSICASTTIQLTASGAASYKWIPAAGLNNASIANPLAQPSGSTTYKVIGYGSDNCFTDTAIVHLEVIPLPTILLGPDTTLPVGSILPMRPAVSSDTKSILWSPSSYLTCTTCLSPVATPRENMNYIATVKNSFGCKASDTIRIKLQCTDAGVFIPNSFTPNKDGVNDVFYPRGKGIKSVRSFRVFDRWGELVFERKDFNIDDKRTGWDGTYNGKELPTGVFVYTAELICDTGESFTIKGTIMIIR